MWQEFLTPLYTFKFDGPPDVEYDGSPDVGYLCCTQSKPRTPEQDTLERRWYFAHKDAVQLHRGIENFPFHAKHNKALESILIEHLAKTEPGGVQFHTATLVGFLNWLPNWQ